MGHEYELESEPLSFLIGGISPPAAPGSATRRPPDWGSRDWESWPCGELAEEAWRRRPRLGGAQAGVTVSAARVGGAELAAEEGGGQLCPSSMAAGPGSSARRWRSSAAAVRKASGTAAEIWRRRGVRVGVGRGAKGRKWVRYQEKLIKQAFMMCRLVQGVNTIPKMKSQIGVLRRSTV